jgi:isopentenyl diphosphate isomerase/L-lactate dehydrogenase-like FMN-dependent dehydrogenase
MAAMPVMTSGVDFDVAWIATKVLQARAAAILRKLMAAMSVMTSSVESLTLLGSQQRYCKFALRRELSEALWHAARLAGAEERCV